VIKLKTAKLVQILIIL